MTSTFYVGSYLPRIGIINSNGTYAARVHVSLSSAQHVLDNPAGRGRSVLEAALGVRPDGNRHLLQSRRLRTTWK